MADDNFLVDLDRALKIAEGLIRAGGNIQMEYPGHHQPDRAAYRR